MSLITPYLYLGDANDAQNIDFLKSRGISIIVNAAKEIPNSFSNSFTYVNTGWDDVPEQPIDKDLPKIANLIINSIKNRKIVFVHCRAGVSRSSSVVIFTLMKLHNWGFDKSLNFVRMLHPRANPNPGFVKQIRSLDIVDFRKETYINLPQDNPSGTELSDTELMHPEMVTDARDSEPAKKWSKLTIIDTKEDEKPEFVRSGNRSYAKIF